MMRKDNLLLLVIGLLPWSLWSVFYGVKVLPKLHPSHEFDTEENSDLLAPQPKESMLRVTVKDNSVQEVMETNQDPEPKVEKPQDNIVQQNDSNNNAPNDKKKKPLFILQVGPSKTGTSTLQLVASENDEMLKKDNFHFLGHYRHNRKHPEWHLHKLCESCYKCKKDKNCECPQNWDAFEKDVNYHYSQGHNVLVIEEMFSNFLDKKNEEEHLWKRLVPLLSKWEVRVVFTYRRYYEWVPSAYFQAYNPGGSGKNERKIADRQSWPDDGGKVIQPFPKYFEGFTKKLDRQPAGIKRKWSDHFPNVWVFNMNNGGDYLQTFFCKMMPEATQICEHLKSNKDSVTRNPSSSKHLHFDMLAVEARKRGWLHKKVSRADARDAVENHSKKLGFSTITDFPPDCLSSAQIENLLESSLKLEKEMVPEFFASPLGEADLRARFAEYKKAGRFCSVDVNKSLQDQRWQKFFKDLGPKNGQQKEKAQTSRALRKSNSEQGVENV